ncbi:phage major tail tube protein [Anaeroselena agilis]|uniref:Phage major tail tube protein n=1 Tax=Anaeroselena agilis TaxID=3063788 RepID=A0ABU3NYF6_9FIRM|nr:phage major tail tube protein [Selenomonadales bacterium 4137-cl]
MAKTVNMIPERIVDYRVYKAGTDLIGTADVELPKVQYITEALKGAGILGEIETPTIGQTKSLRTKINFRTITAGQFSLMDCVGHDMEFRSAVQKYDNSSGARGIDSARYVIRGFPTEGDFGKLEQGGANSNSIELECVYFKVVINDTTVLEIDKLNYVFSVNGTDILADVKTALGIV